MLSPLIFLKELTAFPHRGVGSEYEKEAASLINKTLQNIGFNTSEQQFRTPKTYVPIVWEFLGVIIVGLLLVDVSGLVGGIFIYLILRTVIEALLYFDWRLPFFNTFDPWIGVQSQNIIGNVLPSTSNLPKIILMAHYDTAPVSALYKKQTANSFRNSIRLSMLLMALCVPLSILICIFPENQVLFWVKYAFIIYFLLQGIIGTIDYFRKGFTNGASDNATGVVAAIATAERLKDKLKNHDLEIVLTSAEEAGMIGAYHYWKHRFDKNTTSYLINFDTLGAGELKFITQSGSWTTITYENIVKHTAQKLSETDTRFSNVLAGKWHTADFDTAWFARGGVPCLTLAALDENGLMPRIHRPEDTLDHVDTTPMLQAIDFAEAICLELDK